MRRGSHDLYMFCIKHAFKHLSMRPGAEKTEKGRGTAREGQTEREGEEQTERARQRHKETDREREMRRDRDSQRE